MIATSTRPSSDRDVAQHAEIGDRQHRNLGIDHLRGGFPGAPAQIGIAEHSGSPCRPRKASAASTAIRSGDGRDAPLCRPLRPPCCIQLLFGSASVASLTTPVTVFSHCEPQRRGSIAMPASIRPRSPSSTRKHLAGKGPEIVDRRLRAGDGSPRCRRRAGRSIPTNAAHDRRFPFPICRDRRQRRIARSHHRAPIEIGEGRIEELPHHRARKIAVRLLQQQEIAVLPDVAEIGELILVVDPCPRLSAA